MRSTRVVSPVWEPIEWPYHGIRVTGFVVECQSGHWHAATAEPAGSLPLPPEDPVSVAAHVATLGVMPGDITDPCEVG